MLQRFTDRPKGHQVVESTVIGVSVAQLAFTNYLS
jgi:hypothetical protein